MQKVIERVIESKNYELSDMLKKIDTLWIQGSIDGEARNRLAEQARVNANAQNSFDILSKLEELDKRVKALEDAKADVSDEEETEVTYPEYTAGKWYYKDDVVSFNGTNCICTAPDGVVCTWSPTEYPAYWSEYIEV